LAVAVAVVIAAANSAAAAPPVQTVKVALLQGEQVVYVDRPGSTLTSAVKALLAGPTKAEAAQEFTTQIPEGTTLRGVSVKNGVATIDLSDKIAVGTRAESLSARITQIVLTATRFRNARYVRVLVKGGTPLGLFPGFVTRYPLTAKGRQCSRCSGARDTGPREAGSTVAGDTPAPAVACRPRLHDCCRRRRASRAAHDLGDRRIPEVGRAAA
jgi:hypothetical protein